MCQDRYKIIGPPGCGKTTFLTNEVKKLLDSGVNPCNLAYLTFTKKAAQEAQSKLFGYDLPYVSTIHSLAYRLCGFSNIGVMDDEDYSRIGKILGIPYKANIDCIKEYGFDNLDILNKYIFILSTNNFNYLRDEFLRIDILDKVKLEVDNYKMKNRKVDFNDMLLLGREMRNHNFKYVIVDESQDLSSLQWSFINNISDRSENIMIAGDDDQAIFEWAGADVNHFIDLNYDLIQLEVSHRLRNNIYKDANKLIKTVDNRIDKAVKIKAGGRIHYLNGTNFFDYNQIRKSKDTWYFLFRHKKDAQLYYNFLKEKDIYADLFKKQNSPFLVSTIHQVKGGEADNVLLFTKVNEKCYKSIAKNDPYETRLMYVGMTRAKKELYIVDNPVNSYSFKIRNKII